MIEIAIELRSLGLSPDFIVCRSSNELLDSTREKIGLFCNVPQSHVISAYDVDNIYEVPLLLKNQNLDKLLCNRLKISNIIHNSKVFNQWSSFCEDMGKNNPEVNIVMVGKYMDQSDSYLSVMNALMHSAIANKKRLNLILVDSTQLEEQTKSDSESAYLKAWSLVKGADGIIVPGGFGKRGIEGKIAAAKFARENTIPYLGICLGFQIAVIEYARSVLGIKSATSEEFDPSACDQSKAIILMPESGVDALGGTMRLGLKKTLVSPQSSAFELYNQKFEVFERHRHRYEVNPALVANLNSNGLLFTGKDEKGSRMEILELPKATHPFFMASQFHPEYLSRPFNPAPLFLGFITAASKKKN